MAGLLMRIPRTVPHRRIWRRGWQEFVSEAHARLSLLERSGKPIGRDFHEYWIENTILLRLCEGIFKGWPFRYDLALILGESYPVVGDRL